MKLIHFSSLVLVAWWLPAAIALDSDEARKSHVRRHVEETTAENQGFWSMIKDRGESILDYIGGIDCAPVPQDPPTTPAPSTSAPTPAPSTSAPTPAPTPRPTPAPSTPAAERCAALAPLPVVQPGTKYFTTAGELKAKIAELSTAADPYDDLFIDYGYQPGIWDVSRVTNFSGIFDGYRGPDYDLNHWDTSQVTNFQEIFF